MPPREEEGTVTQTQHSEVLAALERLHSRLSALEERLQHHYESEHAAFDDLVAWIRGGKLAVKLIGWTAAIIAALAASYDWIIGHFHITRL